ncbi:MAG: delta-60 repeat domain-containing protein [Parvularculaceae bacterium]
MIGGEIGSGIGSQPDIRHLARLLPDASVDTSFITGAGFDGPVRTLALQPDGMILVGGDFTAYDGTPCGRIVRLFSNGSLDGAFVTATGTGADDSIRDILVEANGDLLVGGQFQNFNGQARSGILRLNSNGSLASALSLPFNAGYGTRVNALAPGPSGTFLVGGSFYVGWTGSGWKPGIARLLANGNADPSFNVDAGAHVDGSPNSIRSVYDILPQPDGSTVIMGNFTAYDEHPASYCARILSNGAFDPTFASPAFDTFPRVGLYQGNDLNLVAGAFASQAGGLQRLDSSGSQDSSFDVGSGPEGPIFTLAQDADGALWAGGYFFSFNGVACRPIVKLIGGISPYDLWVRDQFTHAQIAAGDADPHGDPDLDDIPNLAEMAMGSDPHVANTGSAFNISSETGVQIVEEGGLQYLEIRMDKTAAPDGLWYMAQFSNDLTAWAPAIPTPETNATYTVIENSATRFVVRDKTPISTQRLRYGRILLNTP